MKYMISKHILLITFLNKPGAFSPSVKWFNIFLSNTKNSTVNHFFAHSLMF